MASLWYILSSAHSRSNLNDVPEQLHIGLHQLLHAADDLCCHTLPRDEFPELKDIDFLFFPAVDLSTLKGKTQRRLVFPFINLKVG